MSTTRKTGRPSIRCTVRSPLPRIRCSAHLSVTIRRARSSSERDSVFEEDRMRRILAIAAAIATVNVATPTLGGQANPQLDAVRAAVSTAEMQKTLDALNIDRTSGKEGERRASDYLVQKLTEYGVRHTRYDARLYMSWPVQAELSVLSAEPFSVRGVTPAFGASTPAGGLTGDVVFIAPTQVIDRTLHGKIVVAP